MANKWPGSGTSLQSYRLALVGNSADADSQQSVTGKVAKRLDTLPSAKSVGKGTTQRQSSVLPTEHSYHRDEDRMICEHCGFWYHV